MSNTYQEIQQTAIREVVVGKKCDICFKDIPPTSRSIYRRTTHPYFDITTHHSDWGNDSCDSYEYFHACSPACALKFATEYLNKDFNGCHSREIEIEHRAAWFMPEEVSEDE